jgi:hypothetical protein
MKVFVSHAPQHEPLARRVAQALRGAGIETWDQSLILPGDNWGAEIGKALQEADTMLVLLATPVTDWQWVERDVSYALGQMSYKGRVVPVLAASPEQLPWEEVPWVLHRFQPIEVPNLSDDEREMDRLVDVLRRWREPSLTR